MSGIYIPGMEMPENCYDCPCIDAENGRCQAVNSRDFVYEYRPHWCPLVPAADVVEVKHGRWNEESPDYLDGDSVYVCSVCGETWTLIEGTPLDNNMHYCPSCGAKMKGEE